MYDFQKFQEECRQMMRSRLGSAKDSEDIAMAVSVLQDHCEQALANLQLQSSDVQIACTEGCGTCCAINVAVLIPEAILVSYYLHTNLQDTRRRDLTGKLSDLCRAVRWLDDDERLFLRRSCAFLDANNSCSIWPLRPLLCRSITSTDAEACQQALLAPVFGAEQPVLMNLVQRSLYETAFAGMGEALKDLGLDHRSAKLTCSVSRFAQRPELASIFLKGGELGAF